MCDHDTITCVLAGAAKVLNWPPGSVLPVFSPIPTYEARLGDYVWRLCHTEQGWIAVAADFNREFLREASPIEMLTLAESQSLHDCTHRAVLRLLSLHIALESSAFLPTA